MTAPATTAKKMTLPELRNFEGQLFIKNNTPNFMTFHEPVGDKRVDFDLEPVGEPNHIAFLPKLALEVPGLQRLWMKGSVTISTDPEVEDQIMLLHAKSVGASEERMQEIMGTKSESNVHNQIEERECLVCGKTNPQTKVIERGRVLQSRRQVKEGIPPLCPEHQDKESQYVPRLVSDSKGEEHWEFDSVQMTQTQR